jgi:hypothetical protein
MVKSKKSPLGEATLTGHLPTGRWIAGRAGGYPATAGQLAGMNDEFFFVEKLQRAISFDIDGIAKVAVRGRKHGNHGAGLMVIGCLVDPLADCKLRHRELLLESPDRIIRPNWLTDLKHAGVRPSHAGAAGTLSRARPVAYRTERHTMASTTIQPTMTRDAAAPAVILLFSLDV